jgi:uncharacterized caspase-like protein
MRLIGLVFFVCVFAGFALQGAHAEKRIALVIGNGAYGNQPLSNPANDATLMAETLRTVGFEVVEVIDADGRDMKKAVHTFSRSLSRAGSDAVGFVYYAGHGIQAQGENYMIPVDARIEEAIDVELEGFPASTLLSVLQNAGNRLNIVVMDACRNNPYKAATRSSGSGLARMDAPSGTLIAYSTAPGKIAADGRGSNSPYTRALARSITTPGAKVEDIFKTVRVAVMERTNDAQVPWESSSLTGDFFFVDEAPEPAPAPLAAPSAPAEQDNTVELAYWDAIKEATDAGLFEAYLSRYPDGLFAPLAKAKITAIRNRSATSQLQSDTAFFQAIQNSQNKGDFEAYLEQYPNGTFASLAQARIAAIERQTQQTASNRSTTVAQSDPDHALWNEVKNAVSVAELQVYLDRFPNGRYADIAAARIAGITEQRKVAALTPPSSAHPMDGTYRVVIKGGKSMSNQTNFPFCAPFNASKDSLDATFVVKDGATKTESVSTGGLRMKLEATVTPDGRLEGTVTSRGKRLFTLNETIAAGPIEKARNYAECRILLTIEKHTAAGKS